MQAVSKQEVSVTSDIAKTHGGKSGRQSKGLGIARIHTGKVIFELRPKEVRKKNQGNIWENTVK